MEMISIALVIGMFFTGACILNFMFQNAEERSGTIDNPNDLIYATGFLFGMLGVILCFK